MGWHEASPGNAPLGILFGGRHARDELDARPDPARVLPSATGAAEPLAQEGPCENEPPFRFLKRPGQRRGLSSSPHTNADERAQQIRTDSQPRSLGDVVNAGTEFEAASGTDDASEQVGQRLTGTFDARRNHACGDDGRFQQPEMVFGKIEDLAQSGDVGGRSKIHRGEAEQRFIEHAQPGTHRWPRSRIASVDTEVH